MTCPVCEGKGTQWLGTEAEVECGFCKGTGKGCEECAELAKENARLTRDRDAARAHFRRACELLAETAGIADSSWCKPADVWQVEIMVEVNKQLGVDRGA